MNAYLQQMELLSLARAAVEGQGLNKTSRTGNTSTGEVPSTGTGQVICQLSLCSFSLCVCQDLGP
eukprot:6255535-Amphidinium_carterae.1